MDKGPGGGLKFVLAMGVCCAVPLLLATGGLTALATWLADGRLVWLLLSAALALVALVLIFRPRRDVG